MKKLLTGVLAGAALAVTAAALQAGDKGCSPARCGPVYQAQAPCGPTFVEQKVTAYRCEQKTRKVERVVQKMHTRVVEEPHTWTEWVREDKPVVQKVTCWVPQWKEVPCVHRVCEWYSEPTKVKVTRVKTELVNEPCKYQVCERIVTPVKRMVTTYRYEPKEVMANVQVCRMVGSCIGSRCGSGSACAPAWETCQVKRTVMNCIPEQKEVTVNEVSHRWVTKDGVRSYHKCTPYQEEVTVNVSKQRWVEKAGKRMVCDMVQQTKDVTHHLVSCKPVQKQGMRKRVVCEWKPEKVMVDEAYWVTVPYETVVKVPVHAGGSCGHHAKGGDCGSSRGCGLFGGLFGRKHGCK